MRRDIIDWDAVRAVVFDVDGTLYDGPKLRRRMLLELLTYCLANPRRLTLLHQLQVYRREREHIAEEELQEVRRLQFERPASRLGISAGDLEQIVLEWIHRRPLRHLDACRIAGARPLFEELRASGRRVGVLSDYPAAEKLHAMGLDADRVVCGTDPDVDRLKPHPAGLTRIVADFGLKPSQCLLVGDRDDRDGEIARRLDMAFLLRSKNPRSEREFADFRQVAKDLRAT